MRTIKGWTKEEQEELEWQKESYNNLDDVIDTLYDNKDSSYLYDKYNQSGEPVQVIFDIVDFWRSDAKFPVKEYYLKIDSQIAKPYLFISKDTDGLEFCSKHSIAFEDGEYQNTFTMDEIKKMDERLVPFAVEVDDD